MKPKFSLKHKAFVIENYNQARPFSSFLPGIAGHWGKPLWLFYTNRGQCVSSFGIRNKNSAMLEFYPANKAYANTPLLGFRTFIRYRKGSTWAVYEPFQVNPTADCKQTLSIRPHEIELVETHRTLGLKTRVVVWNAPEENLPVLIRQVEITNLKKQPFKGELLDGLPQIVPFGLNEWLTKQMSRTMEAFAEAPHAADRLPFYKLKTEPSDKPEVEWIHGGYFAFSILAGESLPIVVDPESIFGHDTSFQKPDAFASGRPVQTKNQRTESSFCSAFAYAPLQLKSKGTQTLSSYFGQADAWPAAAEFRDRVRARADYSNVKRVENGAVMTRVSEPFAIHSALPMLDAYSEQSYLDNVLRGGQPVTFSDGVNRQMCHVYSRKHGDMERDYNFFELSPTYYSQGNGNFRDVNQNRRAENYLHPEVGASNIETFFNLIQLDGYNPLVIQYEKFLVKGKYVRPGDVLEKILESNPDTAAAEHELQQLLAASKKTQDAVHGEGYWADHWTYNLDLLENFAALYPDELKALFTQRRDFTFYDNDHTVRPRDQKYVLRSDGAVRQMHAVGKDAEKSQLLRGRKEEPHKVRTRGGTGSIYQTTLLAKVLGLIAIKGATLDPFGVGLEMEAEKPGWCDALNGLPGLLGSSVNESIELLRLVQFVRLRISDWLTESSTLDVAEEVAELLRAVQEALAIARLDDFFRTWDALSSLRERFRQKTRLGVTGQEQTLSRADIETFLKQMETSLSQGLARAYTPEGLCVTYYINEVAEYEKLPQPPRASDLDAAPLQHVKARRFKQIPVSPFLEGPMHAMRVTGDPSRARKLYQAVKNSELYDVKLKMYKLNVPLTQESFEVGRTKIFTPGWLENESIFLHMHYKFLFELLRAGLTDDFFAEMKHGVIAFMDPKVYGRSVFENSSFIASSSFPDARVHGTGFVARLSGSTAEWISMVMYMGLGPAPFQFAEGTLAFQPKPSLPGWMFTSRPDNGFEKNTFAFKAFGGTWIVYRNPGRRDTFGGRGLSPSRYTMTYPDGREVIHEGAALPDALARDLRAGHISRLLIDLR